MKLYIPFDEPRHLDHDGREYVLPANSEVEVPDEVGRRALLRLGEIGVVELIGVPYPDEQARKLAEERYTLFLKRELTGPRGLSLHLTGAARKRGLLGSPPEAPSPPEPPAEG